MFVSSKDRPVNHEIDMAHVFIICRRFSMLKWSPSIRHGIRPIDSFFRLLTIEVLCISVLYFILCGNARRWCGAENLCGLSLCFQVHGLFTYQVILSKLEQTTIYDIFHKIFGYCCHFSLSWIFMSTKIINLCIRWNVFFAYLVKISEKWDEYNILFLVLSHSLNFPVCSKNRNLVYFRCKSATNSQKCMFFDEYKN